MDLLIHSSTQTKFLQAMLLWAFSLVCTWHISWNTYCRGWLYWIIIFAFLQFYWGMPSYFPKWGYISSKQHKVLDPPSFLNTWSCWIVDSLVDGWWYVPGFLICISLITRIRIEAFWLFSCGILLWHLCPFIWVWLSVFSLTEFDTLIMKAYHGIYLENCNNVIWCFDIIEPP